MEPKKILFLCDNSDIDIVEHSFKDYKDYDLILETTQKIFDYGVQPYLARTVELLNQHPEMFDAVVGTHDSSAVFASVICEQTGKKFASVPSIINCQNKYLCRMIQKECIPENTPEFCLALDFLKNPKRLKTPFFIKPARSNISFGTHIINSAEELEYYIGMESQSIAYHNQYYLDALSYNVEYYNQTNIDSCNSFLCENLISGEQVTVDGFVFNGKVTLFGNTRAVFYENTHIFSHHEFPYDFSPELEVKIQESLSTLIVKLGIDNSFFNVELRVDEKSNSFYIIEVNSRIAFQFAQTIKSVRGFDPLHLLCHVAVGRSPCTTNKYGGAYKYCYNFELHSFSDQKILKTPTQIGYEEIKLLYPEAHVRNLIREGNNLSDYKHNPESYRYCIIDIPGNSRDEIMEKYRRISSLLTYEFEEISIAC